MAYIVLAISAVLEGTSFRQASRQAKAAAVPLGVSPGRYLLRTSETTVRSVFFEDFSALIGIAIAVTGLVLHQVTGNPVYDAMGSILVGVLLGVVAVFLMVRNTQFLVGVTASPTARRQVSDVLLRHPDVESVSFMFLEYVGPAKLFVVAAVDLTGDDPETRLAERLQRIEDEVTALDIVQQCLLTLSAPTARRA